MKVTVNDVEYSDAHAAVAALESAPAVPPPQSPVERAASSGLKPTEGQSRAVDATAALMKRPGPGLLTVVGYAGVGKTTMIRLLAAAYPGLIVVTPTGKAALRVGEASGQPAITIHRWIYKSAEDPKTGKLRFDRRKAEELLIPRAKLVVIDEASMVSAELWTDLWRVATAYDLKVVAIGDGFQLPPVQEKGTPAFSLLDPVFVAKTGGTLVELKEVLRQSMDSPIIRASMMLRDGMGVKALGELPRVERNNLLQIALATRAQGGVIISATNNTRFRVNEGMRVGLGFKDGNPVEGEPLLILRNNYDVNKYNGEQVEFRGWTTPPGETQHVRDRYSGVEADVRYGVAGVDGEHALINVEELSGGIRDVGGLALSIGAEAYARRNNLYDGERVMPFLQANFGYCYTAHKSQGSEWPFALVMLEPNIKMDTEDGRRWSYTAITRAKTAAAIFYGKV